MTTSVTARTTATTSRVRQDFTVLGVITLVTLLLASVSAALTGAGAAATATGYWTVASDGTVTAFGDAEHLGDRAGSPVAIVDMATTDTGLGYVLLGVDGSLESFGDATDLGDVDGILSAGEQAIAVALTASSDGYWIFTDLGRVVAFGTAPDLGDVTNLQLVGKIIDAVPTPSSLGYYLLGSDGGVFAFGDAEFFGSVPELIPVSELVCPVVGLVSTSTTLGYWLVACDGGVFSFGDAGFAGSIPGALPGVTLNAPINGMVTYGNGYLMVADDGGVSNFATDRAFSGSLGGTELASPIVGVEALPAPATVPSTAPSTVPDTTSTTESQPATNYLESYTINNAEYGTEVTVTVDGSTRTIETNALPDHETGEFPNAGNPNTISAQTNTYSYTTAPTFTGAAAAPITIGVAVNGVKLQPGTAETVTCSSGETLRVEALQEAYNLGLDFNNAHVQPDGEYHYHGVSELLAEAYSTTSDLVHIGFAADGYLIYYSKSGAYSSGYSLSTTPRTGTGCTLSLGNASVVVDGTTPDGTYLSDWEWDASTGDLDSCNGTTINGTYAYVMTNEYPYISRCLNGAVAADAGPGAGGPPPGAGGPPPVA